MRQDTLVFLLNDKREIMLAMKKRGFGVGKWNGVGGKVDSGETIETAAVREANEEVGVVLKEETLVKVAQLTFHFKDKEDWDICAHVFLARTWEGEPIETEEMSPMWFGLDEIPYDKMWVDDIYWLPLVLKGDYVEAEMFFNHDGSALERYTIVGMPPLTS